MHLHLHDDIDSILLRDEKLGDEPKVIPVLVEAHGGPLLAGDLIAQRDPMVPPAIQGCANRDEKGVLGYHAFGAIAFVWGMQRFDDLRLAFEETDEGHVCVDECKKNYADG